MSTEDEMTIDERRKYLRKMKPLYLKRVRLIGRGEARRVLVQCYLDNVVTADGAMIAKVFHVFKWTPMELERAIAALIEEGAIQEVKVKGAKLLRLVSGCVLDRVLQVQRLLVAHA
jgi:hypothetical protein